MHPKVSPVQWLVQLVKRLLKEFQSKCGVAYMCYPAHCDTSMGKNKELKLILRWRACMSDTHIHTHTYLRLRGSAPCPELLGGKKKEACIVFSSLGLFYSRHFCGVFWFSVAVIVVVLWCIWGIFPPCFFVDGLWCCVLVCGSLHSQWWLVIIIIFLKVVHIATILMLRCTHIGVWLHCSWRWRFSLQLHFRWKVYFLNNSE